ncbi:MAG: PaaI family thioesterase [Anaerolineales bacterium]
MTPLYQGGVFTAICVSENCQIFDGSLKNMNPDYQPAQPDFEIRIRDRFKRQQVMQLLSARLVKVLPGEVHIELPFHPKITQQHGYVHAGIITTILDSACGYAAFSLMPADSSVLSVEFKMNFLYPAEGETFIGIGKVVKSGRTLTVCSGELQSVSQEKNLVVAIMQATMIAVSGKPQNITELHNF